MRARSGSLLVGTTIVVMLVLVALCAPLVSPYDPKALSGASLEEPSARHLLGTNDVGHDIFSQLLWGARVSLLVAVAGSLVATAIGAIAGMAAGLVGGVVDSLTMRAVDLFLTIPGVPLVVVISALAGPSRPVLIGVIAMVAAPAITRVVRSQALTVRQRGFVSSARGLGGGTFYLLRRHLLPALAPVIVTQFVFWVPIAVFLEAGLAFLGLGDPIATSWGLMLNRALEVPGLYFTKLWVWWVLPAGFAISLTVIGFTFVGIGLEPFLQPRVNRSGARTR